MLLGVGGALWAHHEATDRALPRAYPPIRVDGAGATFSEPALRAWLKQWDPKRRIVLDYRGVGSPRGIQLLSAAHVDFAASDISLDAAKLSELADVGPGVTQVPLLVGAVAVSYELPGHDDLRIDAATLAAIMSGSVAWWDDPRLAQTNPGVRLPHRPMHVVHRAEPSGTTWIFTQYLSSTSRSWRRRVGASASPRWQTGIGARGNDGVAKAIAATVGSIGYLEVAHLRTTTLQSALLESPRGEWVGPGRAAIRRATTSAATIAAGGSLLESDDRSAYPVVAISYALFSNDPSTQRDVVVDFLRYALGDGQQQLPALGYEPLPEQIRAAALDRLRRVGNGG